MCIKFKTFTVNDSKAYGLDTLYDKRKSNSATAGESQNNHKQEAKSAKLNEDKLITDLDEEICKDRNLVGDKACQLSRLRSMKTLNVPKGICLTVNALTNHIAENAKLRK